MCRVAHGGHINGFVEKVEAALKNGGIKTTSEQRATLANYAIGKNDLAVNMLRNVKTDKVSDNPFIEQAE